MKQKGYVKLIESGCWPVESKNPGKFFGNCLINKGKLAEWLNATVLKTVEALTLP